MATSETPGPRAQRVRLGAELRRLRRLAGLSGREIARRTGISQAQISRMENGDVVPSLPDVRAWVAVLRLSREHTRDLESLAVAALNEYTLIKDWQRAGLAALQQDVREMERTTRVLHNFQAEMVPGLLQTPDYARCVAEIVSPGGDIPAAIAARMERQAILYDPSRSFEFILAESALRWRPANAGVPVLAAQYDRLAVVAGLANVDIGILPSGVPMESTLSPSFVLYDVRDEGYPPFAAVELPHKYERAWEPTAVEAYRDTLSALRRPALYGPEAVAFINHLRNQVTEDPHE